MTDVSQPMLDTKPMTRAQIVVVGIMVALNALDGFDVLSISFASPGIAKEWGIDRAALGWVLTMELIGMAAGSVLLGRAGDRFGRKPTALASLVLMALGMFMVSTATSIAALSTWRVLTGFGIGGMLAVTNAITPEVSNNEHRSMAVSLMVIGYPIGAVLGGTVVSVLLKTHDWRAIFEFGSACTALMIPLVLWLVPETPAFLLAKRPEGALARLNHSLAKLGHVAVDTLPAVQVQSRGAFLDLFAPGMARTTVLLTLAYFFQIIAFYFILKWTPKIVVDMGFAPSTAGGVLIWANIGGALGGALFGLLSRRFALKAVSLTALVAAAVMVTVFGQSGPDLTTLTTLAFAGAFCGNAAMVGLYGLAAVAFPASLRSSGTGFVIGVGRGGAALGPPLAGALFASGWSLGMVAATISLGSLAAFAAVAGLRLPKAQA
ncbi:MAG: MFS transporter [Novosphingobium sp.]